MRVILLQDVPKVGRRLDIKEVADGFAINSLLPKKLAKEATDSAVKEAEALRAKMETDKKISADLLLKNIEKLSDANVKISEKASDKGHLFASIHAETLAKALKEQTRIDVHPDFIDLKEPIKSVGEYDIPVKVGEKKASFKLTVETTQ